MPIAMVLKTVLTPLFVFDILFCLGNRPLCAPRGNLSCWWLVIHNENALLVECVERVTQHK